MIETLSPSQQSAFDQLNDVLPLFSVVGLTGRPGAGKSTVLRKLWQRTGGEWIASAELLHAMRQCHPLAIEETFQQLILAAFQKADSVYLDDLSLLTNVVAGG